ncbi:MAG: DUF1206 domain-containing protein [Anaeromyxobacteraceae bacterium]
MGFLAKTVLYGLVAEAAVRAAHRSPQAATDPKGALFSLARSEHGDLAAGIVAAAIGALGLWFVLEAVVNPFRTPGTALGVVSRAGQALGGLGYVALALAGFHFASGGGEGPSGDALARAFVARGLAHPEGDLGVAAVGVAAAVVGVRQMLMGLSGTCLEALELSGRPVAFRGLARALAAAGFGTQGALFTLVGARFTQAAWYHRPAAAAGTAGALELVARTVLEPRVLLVAAAGLTAYALYAGVEGACRRFPPCAT